MRRHTLALAIALLTGPAVITTPAQKPTARLQDRASSAPRFDLTVDSIMRGPDLVGYPPTGLCWAADSQKRYFEWRKPGEKEPSTYVVGREGGESLKLAADEVKAIPSANGRWDKAHRRALLIDGGDIVLVDSASATRPRRRSRDIRWGTPVSEAHPGERHLYSVSIDGGDRTNITTMVGSNQAQVSPDGAMLGLVYS